VGGDGSVVSVSGATAAAASTACARPAVWCTHGGAEYSLFDCDGDGIADPYCEDSAGRTYSVLSSQGCERVGPNAQCQTITPTAMPTHVPTAHACDDGSHGCDTTSTRCAVTEGHGFSCECLEGFESVESSTTACAQTPAPTATPTQMPTHVPTAHACDDGSHGCDTTSTRCAPTAAPTLTPTMHPCTDGSHGCDTTTTQVHLQVA
jgi:hypothetical protein